MIRFPRALFFSGVMIGLVLLFQNCGQARPQPEDPRDDRVSKIGPTMDGSEEEVVISSMESGILNESLPPESAQSLMTKLNECRHLLGDQRVACLSLAIALYYSLLESSAGYTVVDSEDCFLAFKKATEPGMEVMFDATCRFDPEQTGLISIHLDDCLLVPSPINPQLTVESAWLPLRRGRYFQRVRESKTYIESGSKSIGLFGLDVSVPEIRDACGKTSHSRDLGTNKIFDVP